MMYNVEMVCTPLNRLENYEVHFRDLVGSIEGPRRVLDLLGVSCSVPRVPLYDFCCLECKNIAHTANFSLWALLMKYELNHHTIHLIDIAYTTNLTLHNQEISTI